MPCPQVHPSVGTGLYFLLEAGSHGLMSPECSPRQPTLVFPQDGLADTERVHQGLGWSCPSVPSSSVRFANGVRSVKLVVAIAPLLLRARTFPSFIGL